MRYINLHFTYLLTYLLKPEVARQLQELLDMGFTCKSTSAMASPIVCILKCRNGENGIRLHVCCDYRYLNKVMLTQLQTLLM